MVGSSVTTSLQIYLRVYQWTNFENRLRLDGVMVISLVSSFLGHIYVGVKRSNVKVTRHKKQCRYGFLHSCECWLVRVLKCLQRLLVSSLNYQHKGMNREVDSEKTWWYILRRQKNIEVREEERVDSTSWKEKWTHPRTCEPYNGVSASDMRRGQHRCV